MEKDGEELNSALIQLTKQEEKSTYISFEFFLN
jgi:hypothetical protein